MNWLATELAQQGYIVAAPDHPGTTTFNKDADQAAKLWGRPHDLSRVIDVLTTDPKLVGKVDIRRIAAIRHSLGGWTVPHLRAPSSRPSDLQRGAEQDLFPQTR